MVGANTSVYEFDKVVRGQHVYKSAWTPLTDRTRKCILQGAKECDKYAVNNQLYQHPKGVKRDIENKLIFHNVIWHYFSVY